MISVHSSLFEPRVACVCVRVRVFECVLKLKVTTKGIWLKGGWLCKGWLSSCVHRQWRLYLGCVTIQSSHLGIFFWSAIQWKSKSNVKKRPLNLVNEHLVFMVITVYIHINTANTYAGMYDFIKLLLKKIKIKPEMLTKHSCCSVYMAEQ